MLAAREIRVIARGVGEVIAWVAFIATLTLILQGALNYVGEGTLVLMVSLVSCVVCDAVGSISDRLDAMQNDAVTQAKREVLQDIRFPAPPPVKGKEVSAC